MHYQFEGNLTARDGKRHLPHRFFVPAQCDQIDIQLRFTPGTVNGISNMLTLTVFDSAGFRGAGHRGGDVHSVRINAATATPGYLSGALPAGEWVAQIDTHMIMPGEPVHYWLEVTLTAGSGVVTEVLTRPAPPTIAPRGAGWYRGDLHSHTNHSDADERTVAELVQTARAYGLDFIFLTDHNTTSGLDEMYILASDDLLTLGGVELTTFWGHALCLGARHWIDWRVRPGTGDMARIATATDAQDQVFIIAHPQAVGDPACTGCTWRFPELMPGPAQLVEIWNGPWGGDSNNELALSLWYDWLNQGRRLVATAGTDTHGNNDYAARPGFSVVYAESLAEAAILKGLRAGHLYLSAGPQLTFAAHADNGATWLMGDTVEQPVTLLLTWDNCPADAQAHLLADGRRWVGWTCGTQGERRWRITPDQANWCVVEIRSSQGELLAITNPIYFSWPSEARTNK